MNHETQHAIVIGASMAGLLAARALSPYFDQITLLERDVFPEVGKNRKGVPQGQHTHALLPTGQQVLESFFPGLSPDLVSQGAILSDPMLGSKRFFGGYYHCQFQTDLKGLYLSRPLLEGNVRKRLLALPNIRAIENCDVLGLAASKDKTRVQGVRLIRRQDGSAEEILKADLVVDASGRGSRSPQWLEQLGYEKPEEEQVRIGMGYVSRYYRRNPEHKNLTLINIASQPCTRLGVLAAQEHDRWIVSIAGYLGDHAPTDPDAFLEFSKTLPVPDIYNIIKNSEPLSAPVPATFPANIRRHYERLSRFPDGFLVLGDAICSFNPVYGQGMTVAALEANALHDILAHGNHKLAKRFFKKARKLIDNPWSITVGGDLRIDGVEGKRSLVSTLLGRYLNYLHQAAQHDPVVAMAFMKVVGLRSVSKSLLHPKIVWRVFRTNQQSRLTS